MFRLFPPLEEAGARVALRIGDDATSLDALRARVRAYVRFTRERGLAKGARVAVVAHSHLDTVVALVGNTVAGLISVPINPSSGARELEHVLRDSSPAMVLRAASAVGPSSMTEVIPIPRDEEAAGGGLAPAIDPSLSAIILYTSGTTGAPKGAVHSFGGIAANLDALADAWGLRPDETIIHALPLFHVHGLVVGLFGALRVGATMHIEPRFEIGRVADLLRESRGVLYAVPTMYHRLAEACEEDAAIAEGLGRARLLVSGSAALTERDHLRLQRTTGRAVIERYGLTETLINTALRHDAAPRASWVGPPLRGIELRLVDEARATIDARDEATIGEIAVRGPSVFRGYLGREDATREVLDADGWFYTGDLGVRSPDGGVRIVGRRATDLIKTGGYKVGAGEIEAALLEHPSVAEAAVLGEADEDLGERIVAFVVRVEGAVVDEGALIDHVRALLAPHKRPRAVRFVDALPRNAMGKVMKARLRAEAPRDS